MALEKITREVAARAATSRPDGPGAVSGIWSRTNARAFSRRTRTPMTATPAAPAATGSRSPTSTWRTLSAARHRPWPASRRRAGCSARADWLDIAQAAIYANCEPTGYPYVLARAHELAVVTQGEKAELERLLQQVMLRNGMMPEISVKASNKLLTGHIGEMTWTENIQVGRVLRSSTAQLYGRLPAADRRTGQDDAEARRAAQGEGQRRTGSSTA